MCDFPCDDNKAYESVANFRVLSFFSSRNAFKMVEFICGFVISGGYIGHP
jgi:hypothetical protein